MPTTTARSAKTAELIATALRLNPGHEEDPCYRLLLCVAFPGTLTVKQYASVVWWFKSVRKTELFDECEGVYVYGTVKKDHFTGEGGMAHIMEMYGAYLLEETP